MPRREGDVFLLGTAMAAPFPQINTFICAIDAMILDDRPLRQARLTHKRQQVRGFLGQQGGKGRDIAENSRVATRAGRP
jgi:hypothetical protein